MDLQDEQPEAIALEKRVDALQLECAISFEHVAFHYATRPDVPVLRT